MNQVKQPKQPKALPSLKDAVSFRLLPDAVSYTHLTLPTNREV